MTFDLLSAECLGSVKHTPLGRLDGLLDWAKLRAVVLEKIGERGQKPTGRPAYGDEQLLRVVTLRLLYLCSANEAAAALRARLDWRLFARFNLTDPLPDVSTLNRHWREMSAADALHPLLARIRADVGSSCLKLIPHHGNPAPYPRLRMGSDNGIWSLDGQEQGPDDLS
jgi:hypothetical protein